MAHREGIRAYLKEVKLSGTVIDWGCGTKPMKNYLSGDYKYIGIDKLDHVGADRVIDMSNELTIGVNADYAFCIEVIEHVWNSKQLIRNIYKHLNSGGILYLSQPFFYEVHKEDDRIRYTWRGLKQLLEEVGFKVEDISSTVGDLDHAEGYIVKAVK